MSRGISYDQGNTKWRAEPLGNQWKAVACCDCGLVHGHQYLVIDGKTITHRTWRDERRTAMVRRQMAQRFDIVRVSRSNMYILPLPINQRKPVPRRVTVKIKQVRRS